MSCVQLHAASSEHVHKDIETLLAWTFEYKGDIQYDLKSKAGPCPFAFNDPLNKRLKINYRKMSVKFIGLE